MAVSPLFAHRTRTLGTSAFALVLRRDRDAESFIGSIIFWSSFRPVFLDQRHLRNKPLEFFESFAAGPLPVVQFLPACDEAAGWTWANDETSPSLVRHPNEKSEGNSAKDNQGQSECDANLEPLKK